MVLFIGSCAMNPVTGRSELMLVSEQQEIKMGQEAAPSLNWDFGGEYRDRALEEYLGGIVGRIWRISERPNLPFEFHVQNTSIPNAFALPGYVAMTRGLLVQLENEAQFAAIMGHEAGHVMARHSASRISRGILQQVGLGLGGALLGEAQGADALMALGSITSSLLLLKYDRGQELEADRLGVIYAARLGYDPLEAISAHQRLEAAVEEYMKHAGKTSQSGGFLNDILSTHPRKQVRVEEIRDMIRKLPPYQVQGDGRFSPEFMRITGGIRQVNTAYLVFDDAVRSYENKHYDDADRLVLKALDMNSLQAPFYSLRGRISLARKQYDRAAGYFHEALQQDASFQPALFGLSISEYKRGNIAASLDYTNKSLALYPNHPGSLYVAGLCYHDSNRPQEAISYFGTFAGIVKRHSDVYGYMGINYEKINKISLAVDAYSAQVTVEPDNEMGKYARQRLAVLKSLPLP